MTFRHHTANDFVIDPWPRLRDRVLALAPDAPYDDELVQEIRRLVVRQGTYTHAPQLQCLVALRPHFERWGLMRLRNGHTSYDYQLARRLFREGK